MESKRKIYTYGTNRALREYVVYGTKRLGRHLRGNRADREVVFNPSRHNSDANLTLRTACVGELLKCDRVMRRWKLKLCVRDKTKKETEIF